MNNLALNTAARTILRLVVGFLFTAHGWQKYNEFTIAGTQGAFAQMGVPAADVVAPFIVMLELVGGIALMLGLATRPIAALLTLNMVGAIVLVHASAGIFVEAGGYELALLLGTAALALALVGPGKFSLDHVLFGRSKSKLRVLA
ncbi:DoxX family protein [Arthrobacter sp. TMN-49]